MIDYKELLRKYIMHVGLAEGISFLDDADRENSAYDGLVFTDAEWSELQNQAEDTP